MKKLIIIALIPIVIWTIGFIMFAEMINEFDIDKMEKTDAVVVLTGGKNRINEAAKLLNQKNADKMFISGVSQETSLEELVEKYDMETYYADNVEIGQEAKNTLENAKEVKEWVEKNNISSIRLVTSNYHMPRSMEEIEAATDGVSIIPHPVYSENVAKKWWTSWKSFKFVASEYNKFIFVWIKNHTIFNGR